MAAAHALASLHLYQSSSFPCRSKSKTKTHQFATFKSISSSAFSCAFNSITCKNTTRRNSRLPFVYASISNQEPAFQVNDGDETSSYEREGLQTKTAKTPASLKLLLSAYKEAILQGDEKTLLDIEAMATIIEKEKNQLVEKISTLSSEASSGKVKFLRLQADFDNFRKRIEKERLTIRTDAQIEVIESLLPMVDNFERAKQQIKAETEQEKKIDASYQGIYRQFVEILRSLRVSVVPTIGKPFDPALHEAIAREESQEYKEGIITEEFRRGFLLEGRLLRPAMVKVSAGPPGKRKSANKSAEQQPTGAGIDGRLFGR